MRSLLAILFVSGVAFGQPPAPLSFEVASVKSATQRVRTGSTPDGIVFQGATLRYCTGYAYRVKDFQISGPAWLDNLIYDIAAKIPKGSSLRQVPEMLQALLADRFKLRIHREKKEFPGYSLTVAAGGFKIAGKPLDRNSAMPPSIFGGIRVRQFPDGRMQLIGEGATMTALAGDLSLRLGSPVIDRTETTGHYDFSVDVSPEDIHLGAANENPTNGPSVFESIQKLGLQLKSQKIPLDVIVVDYAEKIPAAN